MMQKLKIAYIGQKGIAGITGGVETHVKELSFRMARAGHEVIVYARPYSTRPEEPLPDTLHLQFLPSLRTKHFDTITHAFLATFHAMFRGVDILHYQSIGPSLLAFLPRILRPSIRVIVTFHSVDREHGKWGRFAKFVLCVAEWTALHFPHATLMTSETNAAYARRIYNKETIVIPTGVIRPVFHPAREITKCFGLREHEYIFIASRLIPHKNIHLVIEAFKKARTDLKLAIAGNASHTDSYEKHLRVLAAGDNRIIFCGRQGGETLEELFSNCVFFINMSNSEGCPTATLEAMSYGKPALLSSILVNHEVAGSAGAYARCEVESIREKIEEMAAKKEELIAQTAMIQKETLARFDWEMAARKTKSVYFGLRFCRDAKRAVQLMFAEKQ